MLGVSVWIGLADTPAVRNLIRLYTDREGLRTHLQAWDVLGPVVFIAPQALQVIVSSIPDKVRRSWVASSSASGSAWATP